MLLRVRRQQLCETKDKLIFMAKPLRQDTKGFCKRTKNLLCCSPLQDAARRKEGKKKKEILDTFILHTFRRTRTVLEMAQTK